LASTSTARSNLGLGTMAVETAANYAALAGATFTGLVSTPASTTTTAGIRLPHGSAPTSPVNGDIWTTTTGLSYRINGATVSPATLDGGTYTGKITTVASTTTTAGFRLPNGTAPTSPISGDLWTTSGGFFANIGGFGTQQFAMLGAATTFTGNFTLSGATISLGNSTAATTIGLGNGATATATTKAINIGTSGVSGSTTTITIGSTSGTTTTFNGTVNAAGLANGVKAWVNFNGTGTAAIRASYNVSSITDFGTADFRVNFTTAMSDANYATICTTDGIPSNTIAPYIALNMAAGVAPTTTAVRISQTDCANEPSYVNVVIIR